MRGMAIMALIVAFIGFVARLLPRKAADKGIARYRIAGSEEQRKAEEARARGDHEEAREWEMRAAAKQTGDNVSLERVAEPGRRK